MIWFTVFRFFSYFKNSIGMYNEIACYDIYIKYIKIIFKSLNHAYNRYIIK